MLLIWYHIHFHVKDSVIFIVKFDNSIFFLVEALLLAVTINACTIYELF